MRPATISNKRKEQPCFGMTLIELLVAVALSAMMMTALIGVLQGLGKQTRLANQMDQPTWPNEVLKLLRRDLLAADSFWEEGGIVWLVTDSPTYQVPRRNLSNISVSREIGYRCSGLGDGRRVLERIEASRAIVLACDVSRIQIERLDSFGNPQPLPHLPGPVPSQVRVWVWDSTIDHPILQKDIVIR
ncbi:PulJ/GspJ family protein [Rhodopirellula europaea]|nr:prepilin-type N-terminal cleavage/methylation domain-containing protein [Rhodopirellula europaea]